MGRQAPVLRPGPVFSQLAAKVGIGYSDLMPKTHYAFRGGPLDGRVITKIVRGRAPQYADGEGNALRPEYGRRVLRSVAGHVDLRSRAGAGCYARATSPEILNGEFTYVYVWYQDKS